MPPNADDPNVGLPSDATEDARLRRRVAELEERLERLQGDYDRLTGSAAYRVVRGLHRGVDRMAPWGSRRRTILLLPLRGIRLIRRDGWAVFLGRLVRVDRWVPRLWRPALPPWDRVPPEER